MHFKDFAQYLEQLESTAARLDLTKIVAQLLSQLQKPELSQAIYLLEGTLLPAYHGLEFQLASKMVLRALARCTADVESAQQASLFAQDLGFDEAQLGAVTELYKKQGDLGAVAQEVRAAVKAQLALELTINDVYERLTSIAQESGTGSQEKKLLMLSDLLKSIDPLSAKFVVRIVSGKLRVGVSTMTIIDALSWVITGGKDDHDLLESAFQKCADAGKLAEKYLSSIQPSDSIEKRKRVLEEYSLMLMTPVVPALCQRLESAQEIIEKMGQVRVEPKYDGLRVQIHFDGESESKKIAVFSRSLEDITHMFPELEQLSDLYPKQQFILDAEAIGYDPKSGALLPFQQTITRKRKHDIGTVSQSVPLKFFVYDLLFLSGDSLIDQPLSLRHQKLEHLLSNHSSFMIVAPGICTEDADTIRQYHEQALEEGLEGIVVKQLSSTYMGGRKGWRWVKMKESEGTTGKLQDTLDVVVMGYYRGRGKRAVFGLGALLVGIFDEVQQKIVSVAKIGTGLSDEQLSEYKQRCDGLAVVQPPLLYVIPESLHPDVVILPEIILEVAADEITASPTHTAGFALRFPRLIKERTDKKWQDCTTVAELASL